MSGLEGKFVFLSGPVTGLAREDAPRRSASPARSWASWKGIER